MNIRTSVLAASLLFSPHAFAQVEVPRPDKPAHRINWEDIHEELAFDKKYAPKDGFGYTKILYFAKTSYGSVSNSSGMVLYLRPEHDGKRSPKGAVICAYEFDDDGVRLVNQFRFKYTANSISDREWVFVLKGIGKAGVTVN